MHRFPTPDMKMEYVSICLIYCRWPETVGLDVDAARDIVLKECPDVHIQVLGEVDFLFLKSFVV